MNRTEYDKGMGNRVPTEAIYRSLGGPAVRDKPKLAMVSTDVRRDLLSPIKYFTKLEVIHFYKNVPYSDLYPGEFDGNLIRYKSMLDLCEKIKKCKPTVIQGSEPYGFPKTFEACVASFLMSKIMKVPMFFPMLENTPPESRFGVLSPPMKKYLKIYARRAFVVLCLNKGAMKNLLNVGVPKNKLVRCNWGTWGVDTDEFTPKGGEAEPNFGRAILFVGRLGEAKGVPYLLLAFRRVKKAVKEAKLVIIGDGPLRYEITRFSRANNLENDIIVLGTVKNRDLPPYFRAAEITVAPSVTTKKWREQIGMANLQSMACGTPVVSTLSGAIPEYVRHNETGILVRERDSDGLADAMIKLLKDDKLRERLGANARKHAVENLDAKKNVTKNEKLLLDLLCQR